MRPTVERQARCCGRRGVNGIALFSRAGRPGVQLAASVAARCMSMRMVSVAVSPWRSSFFARRARSLAKASRCAGGNARTVAKTTAPRALTMAFAVSAVNGCVLLSFMCSFKGSSFRFVGVRGPRVIFRHVAALSGGCASFLRVPSSLSGCAAGGLFLHGGFSAWRHALKSLFFAQKSHSERFRMIRNRSERLGRDSVEGVRCE